jgi:hypothetical protein
MASQLRQHLAHQDVEQTVLKTATSADRRPLLAKHCARRCESSRDGPAVARASPLGGGGANLITRHGAEQLLDFASTVHGVQRWRRRRHGFEHSRLGSVGIVKVVSGAPAKLELKGVSRARVFMRMSDHAFRCDVLYTKV